MEEEKKLCVNCNKELTKVPIKNKGQHMKYIDAGICSACAKKIVQKPIQDEQGKPIWKNWLLPDMRSMAIIIIVLLMFWAFKHDTAQCADAISNPCVFCAKTNCYDPKTRCSNVVLPQINPEGQFKIEFDKT